MGGTGICLYAKERTSSDKLDKIQGEREIIDGALSLRRLLKI